MESSTGNSRFRCFRDMSERRPPACIHRHAQKKSRISTAAAASAAATPLLVRALRRVAREDAVAEERARGIDDRRDRDRVMVRAHRVDVELVPIGRMPEKLLEARPAGGVGRPFGWAAAPSLAGAQGRDARGDRRGGPYRGRR